MRYAVSDRNWKKYNEALVRRDTARYGVSR